MPKLWTDTIAAHRESVRDAILDAAATIIQEQGLPSLTMGRIAEHAGIGRATLYKYFADVHTVLAAWHERVIAAHLHALERVENETAMPLEALLAVLTTYGQMARRHHGHALAPLLHTLPHARRAHAQLERRLSTLIAAGAEAGTIRSDVPPGELARFALQAITAVNHVTSADGVSRIVALIRKAITP